MRYSTLITLEKIQKANKLFFSKESVSFHEDKKYSIEQEKEKLYLKVVHSRGVAWYEIDQDTLELNYTKLMNNY